MLQNGHFDYRSSARDFAWLKLKHAILRLKRALDRDEPFDFLGRTGNGELLLVGEGNLSFAVRSSAPQTSARQENHCHHVRSRNVLEQTNLWKR